MAQRKRPEELRSHKWFGAKDLRVVRPSFACVADGLHARGLRRQARHRDHQHVERSQSVSRALPQRVEEVKRGVWQAGGFPVELPAQSVSETYMKPTSMMYRNFLAMETEELLRSHPVDGAVLMGGCDKTTPGLLMGAISMNLPAIYMPAGPMLRGNWHGRAARLRQRRVEILGRAARRQHQRVRLAGSGRGHRAFVRPLHDDGHGVDDDLGRGDARAHAAGRGVDPRRRCQPSAHGERSGRRIVEMVWEDLKPSDILTRDSFDNAITAITRCRARPTRSSI